MVSLFRIFLPRFSPPATVENLGVAPVPSPSAEDLEAYDAGIEITEEREGERVDTVRP